MEVFNRLKFLIINLSDDEKDDIKKILRADTYYTKLFEDIQLHDYDFFINTVSRKKKKSVKEFNDKADYLMRKILEHFTHQPSNITALHNLKFNEILFLLDKGIDDLAEKKAEQLIKSILETDKQSWLLVRLYEVFFNRIGFINNERSMALLYGFCGSIGSFFWNTENLQLNAPNDFVRFVETFKKKTTDIKDEIYNLNKELSSLDGSTPLSLFTYRMELILKKAYLYSKYTTFALKDGERINEEITKTEKEIKTEAHRDFNIGAHYTMTAFYAQALLTERNLIYKINKIPERDDRENFCLIEDYLIEDIILRMEINKLLIKMFTYNPWSTGQVEQTSAIEKSMKILLRKLKDPTEINICIKTVSLLWVKKYTPTSTYYEYLNDIKKFPLEFYHKSISSANITEPNKESFLQNIVYQMKLRIINTNNY